MIVTSVKPVTLVGAGPCNTNILRMCQLYAPDSVAVDGGAEFLLNQGVNPVATIGDLDSLCMTLRNHLPKSDIHQIAEQDTTDFEKALRNVRAPYLLAAGFTGGRLDHTLASFSALIAHKGPDVIIVGDEDLAFHLRAPASIKMPMGTRVSIFPMRAAGATSTGLKWPLNGLDLEAGRMIATSNEANAPLVTLSPQADGLVVILPSERLPNVLRALGHI